MAKKMQEGFIGRDEFEARMTYLTSRIEALEGAVLAGKPEPGTLLGGHGVKASHRESKPSAKPLRLSTNGGSVTSRSFDNASHSDSSLPISAVRVGFKTLVLDRLPKDMIRVEDIELEFAFKPVPYNDSTAKFVFAHFGGEDDAAECTRIYGLHALCESVGRDVESYHGDILVDGHWNLLILRVANFRPVLVIFAWDADGGGWIFDAFDPRKDSPKVGFGTQDRYFYPVVGSSVQ